MAFKGILCPVTFDPCRIETAVCCEEADKKEKSVCFAVHVQRGTCRTVTMATGTHSIAKASFAALRCCCVGSIIGTCP